MSKFAIGDHVSLGPATGGGSGFIIDKQGVVAGDRLFQAIGEGLGQDHVTWLRAWISPLSSLRRASSASSNVAVTSLALIVVRSFQAMIRISVT